MPDTALTKIEKRIKQNLEGADALSVWTITDDPSLGISPESTGTVLIGNAGWSMDNSACEGQSLHTATVDLLFIGGPQPFGVINRANMEAIAHAHAVMAADRTLGDMAHDVEEIDVAPVTDDGKDVHSAALQYSVQFFTPRDDWFTIIGQGGATF